MSGPKIAAEQEQDHQHQPDDGEPVADEPPERLTPRSGRRLRLGRDLALDDRRVRRHLARS